jgi:5'-3' exonuclease
MISADGVAPRAKMNQQRSRRFRKNTAITSEDLEKLKELGLDLNNQFNSDSISAGTEFMFNLSDFINEYIEEKRKNNNINDEIWKNINILFTGSDVPGEGEHKILEYIRNYKVSKEYINNTKHCIYGLDADLIMLSLITHEPNFIILREDNFLRKKKEKKMKIDNKIDKNKKINIDNSEDRYEIFSISVLREYLELEFKEISNKLKFEFNIERIIDDFVFFCFFIGNDFLPNLNSFDIETGALDNIFFFYKQCLPELNDYITYHGKIDFERANKIFELLSKQELHNFDLLLDKIKQTNKENEKKKKNFIENEVKQIKSNLINKMKQDLYENFIKNKTKEEIKKFKEEKRNKKINYLKTLYDKKMKEIEAKNYKFEDDLNNFDEKQKLQIQNTRKIKIIQKNLVNLFADEDENKSNQNNLTLPSEEETFSKISESSSLDDILYEGLKFKPYLDDPINYNSDFTKDDITNSDLEIDKIDSNSLYKEANKRYNELNPDYNEQSEDLNVKFFEGLVQNYVQSIDKAKEFYYKEKLHFDITTEDGKKEKEKMFNLYLEGLQWVLYYYYKGIQNWRWYYPYHYAPLISDFNTITYNPNLNNIFINNKTNPFKPFQSLLFILPKTSFNLLPKCYEEILKEIPEYYPENFKIDYNGKHTSWEAIALLPFLDESKLLKLEEKYRNLSEEEKKLNEWKDSYMYTAINNNGKREIYQIYQNINTLLDSNYMKKKVDCSFPTLKTIDYNFSNDEVRQYYGPDKYRKVKQIVILPKITQKLDEPIIKKFLFKPNIFVNYPFKSFGKLLGFVFNKCYYYIYDKVMYIDSNFILENEITDLIYKYYRKEGILLSRCDLLCDIALFTGYKREKGKIYRNYDLKKHFYVPFEITSLNGITKDFREYIEHFNALNLEKVISKENKGTFTKGSKKYVEVEVNSDNINEIMNFKNNNLKNEKKNSFEDKKNENNNSINDNNNNNNIISSNNAININNTNNIFINNNNITNNNIIINNSNNQFQQNEIYREPQINKVILNKRKIDKKFKTIPDGAELENQGYNVINLTKQINQSEYSKNKLFNNEKIEYNQIYFYSSKDKLNDNLLNNHNIIFKNLK